MKTLENILEEIKKHNNIVYNNTPKGDKIDFSQTKVNWGTKVIPKEFHIDLNKTYKLRNGWEVQNLTLVLCNSSGNEVTFPIKGTYIEKRVGKKDKTHFDIWTLDGRKDTSTYCGQLDLIAA